MIYYFQNSPQNCSLSTIELYGLIPANSIKTFQHYFSKLSTEQVFDHHFIKMEFSGIGNLVDCQGFSKSDLLSFTKTRSVRGRLVDILFKTASVVQYHSINWGVMLLGLSIIFTCGWANVQKKKTVCSLRDGTYTIFHGPLNYLPFLNSYLNT